MGAAPVRGAVARDQRRRLNCLTPLLRRCGRVEVGGVATLLTIGDISIGSGRTHIRQTLIRLPHPLLRQVRRLWCVLRRLSTCFLNPFFTVHLLIPSRYHEAVAETGVEKDLHSLESGIGDMATPESVPATRNSVVELCWGA